MPGYPIRTPWDQRSVDNSPRPIAASHVLHRLLVPRHPPSALSNLTTKMLASTVQFSTNTQTPHTHHHLRHPHPPPREARAWFGDRAGLAGTEEPQPPMWPVSSEPQQGAATPRRHEPDRSTPPPPTHGG